MILSKRGLGGNERKRSLTKISERRIEEMKKSEVANESNKKKLKMIKRNVYQPGTKKKMVKDKDDGIFCTCSSAPGSVCGSDCNCGMLLSSCSSSCKCGSTCANKPFQKRQIKKMEVVKTEKCGYGIVANEDIKSGEFIIEYVGEVIDRKLCEERLAKLKQKTETNFYLCQINYNMVIDATYKGNKSRYINHSCDPNAEMQKWIIDGETRVGIFANRAISKGEPLTYDYRFVRYGADQDCYCGAVCCRKKLGAKAIKVTKTRVKEAAVKPKRCKVTSKKPKAKPRGKRAHGQSWNDHGERQICCHNCIGVVICLERPMNQRCFGIIRQYDEFSRKHLVTYEDGVTEFIDMSREVWRLVSD